MIRIYQKGNSYVLQDDAVLTTQSDFNIKTTRYRHAASVHTWEHNGRSVSHAWADILDEDGNAYSSEAVFIEAMRDTYIDLISHRLVAAASTNSTLLRAGVGSLIGFAITNTSAGALYAKYYDKATAPTVGTDIPVLTVVIPAGKTEILPIGLRGIEFTLGIGIGLTGLAVDTDTTVLVAGDIIIQTYYE